MRSLLFVPAIEKMLRKIPIMESDAFIIDLEDSISPEKKNEALESVRSYLPENTKKVFIRLDGNLIEKQLEALKGFEIEGFMLPKFETPEHYNRFVNLLRNYQIIALVETPVGVVNIDKIVSCEWVGAIAFGAEDFTSSVGMLNRSDYLVGVRNRLVTYSKAYNKQIFDTPSFILDDPEALEAEIQLAQDMGFDGKLAINPKHTPIIDKVFKSCDVEYIKNVIERYESAGEAVVKIDGKVYEKMHINHLKKILKERNQ